MAEPNRLRRAIEHGPPLVLDAAMGTRLIDLGLDLRGDDPALWNLSRPGSVLQIHLADRAAGSDVLFTNTFGAGRSSLERLGRAGDLGEINTSAASLARIAAGSEGFVIGSLGPSVHEDGGKSSREQALILAEAGVDGLALETHSLEQAAVALRCLGAKVDVPILVSLYTWPENVSDAVRMLRNLGAESLGVNCGSGPESAIDATERFFQADGGSWFVKPSAGLPWGSTASPSRFAELTRRFRQLGVRMIGGCCGTTHEHVAAIRRAVDEPTTPFSGPT